MMARREFPEFFMNFEYKFFLSFVKAQSAQAKSIIPSKPFNRSSESHDSYLQETPDFALLALISRIHSSKSPFSHIPLAQWYP